MLQDCLCPYAPCKAHHSSRGKRLRTLRRQCWSSSSPWGTYPKPLLGNVSNQPPDTATRNPHCPHWRHDIRSPRHTCCTDQLHRPRLLHCSHSVSRQTRQSSPPKRRAPQHLSSWLSTDLRSTSRPWRQYIECTQTVLKCPGSCPSHTAHMLGSQPMSLETKTLPTGHAEHVVAPSSEKNPALHTSHSSIDVSLPSLNLTDSHGVHEMRGSDGVCGYRLVIT